MMNSLIHINNHLLHITRARLPALIMLLACLSKGISAQEPEWHEPATRYRLEMAPEKYGEILFADLSGKIFPARLQNSVSVYSQTGREIPYYFYDTFQLFTGPVSEDDGNVFVYFGFPEKREFSTWISELGPPPDKDTLKLTLVKAWMDNRSEKEVEESRNYIRYLIEKYRTRNPAEEDPAETNRETLKEIEKKISGLRSRKDSKNELSQAEKELRALQQVIKRAETKHKRNKTARFDDHMQNFLENSIEKDKKSLPSFFERRRSRIGRKDAEEVRLTSNPFSKYRNYAARFSGKIPVRESGEYVFAINSRQGSMLNVNGETVVSWLYGHPPSETWEKTGKIRLEEGIHDFAFYYQTSSGNGFAEAAWKKPGDDDFHLLAKEDFSPAWRADILQCADYQGRNYPVVSYRQHGYFLLEEENKADWYTCNAVIVPEKETCVWSSDGTVVSRGEFASFARPEDSEGELVLSSSDGAFEDMILDLPEKKHSDEHIDPNLYFKLWAPSFIYDDETLDLDVEMRSGLRESSKILLKTTVSRKNELFKDACEWIDMKGREETGDTIRFAPQYVHKRNIPLDGSKIGDAPLKSIFL